MSDEATISTTARIVVAYTAGNRFPASELPGLLSRVHATLILLGQPSASDGSAEPKSGKATPAQIRKSITPDALISFVDGKRYKTLKRHLARHGLTPAAYRERYGLPQDYPMVCPSYAAQRSAIAKSIGLGRGGISDAA